MNHVFWLVPNVLAGRPGPSMQLWQLADLRGAGIGAVLSVNDGALCHEDEFARNGMEYKCVPLSPNAPPQEGDIEHCVAALPEAYEFVRSNERRGRATLVHCHAGKDRTGLFLSFYLVRALGLGPSEAIAEVRRVRSIAFTAPGWEELAFEVLSRSRAHVC